MCFSSEYENDRKFSITLHQNIHLTINSEPIYLKVDDPEQQTPRQIGEKCLEVKQFEQESHYENNLFNLNNASKEKTETPYTKPFN